MQKGFSILEMIIVIAIICLMAGVVMTMFAKQKNYSYIESDAQTVLAYLQRARNQTVSAENNNSFGVHIASTTVSLFEGTNYSVANTRFTHTFSRGVTVTPSIVGGAQQVYFQRLTGQPSATGTINFVVSSGASTTRTIYIRASGLAEIQ